MIQLGDIYRKTFHMGNMIFPLSYWFFIDEKATMLILTGSLLLLSLFIEVVRRKDGWLKTFFERWLFVMMKSKEKKGKLTGATWVMLGEFLTVLLFPKDVAIPAMLFLSVGDSFAAIVGIQFGRIRIGEKSLEGTLAGLTACFIVAILYPNLPLAVTIVGGITAMIVELLPISIDDNIRIPVLSGIAMSGLLCFGVF